MNTVETKQVDNEVILSVKGQFVFSINKDWSDAYLAWPANSNFAVDLSAVEHLDSSGLGMLLRLKEYAKGSKNIRIFGAGEKIKKIFLISQFHKEFDIDGLPAD